MKHSVSIVIPASNEAETIPVTLGVLDEVRERLSESWWSELIVVDDGSTDHTYDKALPWADHIIRHSKKRGKGEALDSGWKTAKGDIVLFLDADLGGSVRHAADLLAPIVEGEADMTIAVLPAPARKGGFGIVKGLARQGIYRLSGFEAAAPLSGQRAVRKEVLEKIGGLTKGFGIEVGLTIDAARAGCRIREVPVPFRHRETGRDWSGFCHRGKQFLSVSKTLLRKWRHPVC